MKNDLLKDFLNGKLGIIGLSEKYGISEKEVKEIIKKYCG